MTTATFAVLVCAAAVALTGAVVWRPLAPPAASAPLTELVAIDPAGGVRAVDHYETEHDCRLFERNRAFQVNVLGVKASERAECRAAK